MSYVVCTQTLFLSLSLSPLLSFTTLLFTAAAIGTIQGGKVREREKKERKNIQFDHRMNQLRMDRLLATDKDKYLYYMAVA